MDSNNSREYHRAAHLTCSLQNFLSIIDAYICLSYSGLCGWFAADGYTWSLFLARPAGQHYCRTRRMPPSASLKAHGFTLIIGILLWRALPAISWHLAVSSRAGFARHREPHLLADFCCNRQFANEIHLDFTALAFRRAAGWCRDHVPQRRGKGERRSSEITEMMIRME
jgi:hypothetical protein